MKNIVRDTISLTHRDSNDEKQRCRLAQYKKGLNMSQHVQASLYIFDRRCYFSSAIKRSTSPVGVFTTSYTLTDTLF